MKRVEHMLNVLGIRVSTQSEGAWHVATKNSSAMARRLPDQIFFSMGITVMGWIHHCHGDTGISLSTR
jgi:hypothetical protein